MAFVLAYWYVLPLVLGLACALAILWILARRFPQVSLLDVHHLPDEWQAKKKKELISKRIAEESRLRFERMAKNLGPVRKWWGRLQLQFRIYVGRVQRLWVQEKANDITGEGVLPGARRSEKLQALLQEAFEYLRTEKYQLAEGLFIAAIKLSSSSPEAYLGLGETYLAQQSFDEARETYKFLLRLTPQDDAVMVKLGDIAERQGDIDGAIGYYQQAVVTNDSHSARYYHLAELLLKEKQPSIAKEALLPALELEPKNPKFLDLLVEIAILCNDKPLAEQALRELRFANPENQKLEIFKQRITQLQR